VPLPLVAQEPASPVRTPEIVAEENEKIRSLRDALAALPRHQRDVVTCRYLLDLTEHETAQVLRIPNGTVKSRLSRGLAALQAMLRPTIAPEVVEAERRGV